MLDGHEHPLDLTAGRIDRPEASAGERLVAVPQQEERRDVVGGGRRAGLAVGCAIALLDVDALGGAEGCGVGI